MDSNFSCATKLSSCDSFQMFTDVKASSAHTQTSRRLLRRGDRSEHEGALHADESPAAQVCGLWFWDGEAVCFCAAPSASWCCRVQPDLKNNPGTVSHHQGNMAKAMSSSQWCLQERASLHPLKHRVSSPFLVCPPQSFSSLSIRPSVCLN